MKLLQAIIEAMDLDAKKEEEKSEEEYDKEDMEYFIKNSTKTIAMLEHPVTQKLIVEKLASKLSK